MDDETTRLFEALASAIHKAPLGPIEERCRALDRLTEARMWLSEGFKVRAESDRLNRRV